MQRVQLFSQNTIDQQHKTEGRSTGQRGAGHLIGKAPMIWEGANFIYSQGLRLKKATFSLRAQRSCLNRDVKTSLGKRTHD